MSLLLIVCHIKRHTWSNLLPCLFERKASAVCCTVSKRTVLHSIASSVCDSTCLTYDTMKPVYYSTLLLLLSGSYYGAAAVLGWTRREKWSRSTTAHASATRSAVSLSRTSSRSTALSRPSQRSSTTHGTSSKCSSKPVLTRVVFVFRGLEEVFRVRVQHER